MTKSWGQIFLQLAKVASWDWCDTSFTWTLHH